MTSKKGSRSVTDESPSWPFNKQYKQYKTLYKQYNDRVKMHAVQLALWRIYVYIITPTIEAILARECSWISSHSRSQDHTRKKTILAKSTF